MILIFSTPTCVYCKQVKRYLDHKGIKWEERDAYTDPQYAELSRLYGMTVPLVYNPVSNKGMVGYNIGALNDLIAA